MTEPFLAIREITKRYEGTIAVDGVSLDVREGEFVTFLGPSGSGKTTTLFIVAGFQEPTSGDVHLRGQSLLAVPPHKRNIGMVFQRYTLFPHLTVYENVAFPLRVRRQDSAAIDRKVREVLGLVRLENFGSRLPAQLSGGQQQRVALARALAYDPPLLLMDEPLSALDKKLREEIQDEIRRIHRETGVTILYVTHDQGEALRMADRVALFDHGRIVQIGTGRDLYERPATRFVAGFIGNSNFIDVVVEGGVGEHATVRFPDGSTARAIDPSVPHGSPAALMVRPERLSPLASPNGGLRGSVRDAVFVGEHMQLDIELPWGQRVIAFDDTGAPHRPGDTVGLAFSPDDGRVLPLDEAQ